MSLLSGGFSFPIPPNTHHRAYFQRLSRCSHAASPRRPRMQTMDQHLRISDAIVKLQSPPPAILSLPELAGSDLSIDLEELEMTPELLSPVDIQDSKAAGTATPDPLPTRPMVPTSSSDWEVRKQTIRELYMDQNMILNEVIDIMLTKHKFKAT